MICINILLDSGGNGLSESEINELRRKLIFYFAEQSRLRNADNLNGNPSYIIY